MIKGNKIPCWLSILILIVLSPSAGPHEVLTQTREVARALDPILKRYEVVHLEPGSIERQVRTTGELRLQFEGTDLYFNLEPHDLRAAGYLAEATGPGGGRRTLPPQPVHTFKGKLAGREDTWGRFNLSGSGVEGIVHAPEGWYYLEPLRNYLPGAAAGDLVVYRHGDIKSGPSLTCGVLMPGRLEPVLDRVTAQVEADPPTNYVFEVATEADYEYVQALEGSAEANREILGILNQVEGVFQSELLLQLQVTFQHTWEKEDPYDNRDDGALLVDFRDYWNSHFAASKTYDIAHVWTGNRVPNLGVATGVVCRGGEKGYSLSMHEHDTFILRKYMTAAHEIGHNFGAVHPNELQPPIAGCTNTIMVPSYWKDLIVGNDDPLTFCEFSRQTIRNHVASYNSCLATQPITLQPPTGLTAAAVSTSGVELRWQDNSTNETGFLVFYRLDNSGDWIEIGATYANVTTFSQEGLLAGSTFRYRVRAFNGMETSAFSNEAVATTRAGRQAGSDWKIDTIAGGDIGDNGPANLALLNDPFDVAVDGAGNIYISDWGNARIRRVDSTGTITTVAGTGEHGNKGDGGPAVEAQLNAPTGLALDGAGNLYIADSGNHRIRRIDTEGIITTIAGTGERGNAGDGGPATRAKLNFPNGMALDGAGNLYFSDRRNHRVRRIDTLGTITTIAGSGGMKGYSGDGGPATLAQLNFPTGIGVDNGGNLYITDRDNHRIRRVDTSGVITTVAGTGEEGHGGDGGPAVMAQLSGPHGLAVDGSGNLYIAETPNDRIRRVDTSGVITTVAGTGETGHGGDGGPAVMAQLSGPHGLAVDGSGNLYIADTWNDRIRRVGTSGVITTVAGNGKRGYSGDGGPAVMAQLSGPHGLAVDGSGNLYIADAWNHRIRRVDTSGVITTVAGTGEEGHGGDGVPAVMAQLSSPHGLAVDGSGNLYIADTSNDRIRQVDTSGVITTVAGNGMRGYSGDGGPAVVAQLSGPRGLAVDGSGNLYIANTSNHRIRRVDTSGVITTVAGIGKKGYSGDGPAAAARMYHPEGLTVDGAGNLYIADNFNNRIRRVDPAGNITTIAGAGDHGYGGDSGSALQARLYWPSDVAVDKVGNVYVADTQNHRIRVLTQSRHPPGAPTRLRATAVSVDAINLAWQDNSGSETAFGVQRRVAGAARWVEIATTATDVNTFSDTGLKPTSTYHYRVRAFNYSGASTFSNEASATTLEAFLPTLTRFTPTSGPAGTWVTMTGTHFLGASDVRFNGVSSLQFEIVSMTTIRAVVPPGATSGPISVVTPGGTGISAEPFTVTTGLHSRLFIPIVLRSQGRTPASLFTAELTLTNRGTTTAAVHHTYTVAFGGGSGTAVDSLEPGRQRVIPDAIGYLTALGVPIGSGSAGGTLLVDFSNLSSPSATAVTVRVTTPVEEGSGSAGLAFPGLNPDGLLTGPAFIAGLRHNTQDRSNLAVQNAGVGGEESVTLRVTVYSGDPEAPGSLVLPDLSLPPGGFHQYNGILNEAGFENGYVKVERVEGEAPFYAYGVINDQVNSDGSFVFPVTAGSLEGRRRQTLPVIVETSEFSSELTVTNFSGQPRTLDFEFVSEHIQGDEKVVGFQMELAAGEQVIVPEQVAALRREGVAGLGRRRGVYLGPVFVMAKEGDLSGVVIGARTGSKGGGGTYSVFYNAVPDGEGFDREAWVEGLQQNEENRSNLALVNTGEVDDSPSVFRLEIYNGETGTLEDKVVTKPVPARGWLQVDGILLRASPETKQGYIRIEKMSGENPFLAYGVVNDGGAPGERSGDGAYLPARE